MTTPGSHAPAPGGAVRLATAGFRVLVSTRDPEAAASRVIATKLRSKLLAQADVRKRFFMQRILRGHGKSLGMRTHRPTIGRGRPCVQHQDLLVRVESAQRLLETFKCKHPAF